MNKKKKAYEIHFAPPGISEKAAIGVFYEFCVMEMAREANLKVTISKDDYVRKVVAKEMAPFDVAYYLEARTLPSKEDEIIKDIMSIQNSQLSLSLFFAKRQASIFQSYIDIVENYKPHSLETAIIHEYAIQGNVVVAAEKLNEKGYRINGKTVKSGDISSVLMMSPIDDLHRIVSNQFRKNKGLASI